MTTKAGVRDTVDAMGSTHSLRSLYLIQRWFSKTSIKSTATPKLASQPETWLLWLHSSLWLTKCNLLLIATGPIMSYPWRKSIYHMGSRKKSYLNTSSAKVGLFPILHNYFGGIFPESCNDLRKFTAHETKNALSLFWWHIFRIVTEHEVSLFQLP